MHRPNCSLPELLFDRQLPNKTAMIDAHRTVTYTELAAEVSRIAAGLRARGVQPGDVIALRLDNSIDYASAFHGALTCGATITPVASYATETDVAAQLTLTNSKLLFDAALFEQLRNFPESWAGAYPVADRIACLPLSSGTTGAPKAVELTHANLVANTIQFSQAVPITSEDTCLAVLPLTHIYGLTALMNTPLLLGATVVAQNFAVESFLDAHQRHRVTATFIAPPLARLLATHPDVDRTDFSHLRVIVSGAAALHPSIGAAAERRVQAKIYQGYGMSEASPVTHIAQHHDTPVDSIGSPLPDTEVRIVDPETLLDTDGVGELWIRGPQVMRGYLGDPEATSHTIVAGGWLRTGDLARRAGHNYFIVDRLKDLILSHGFQVSPVKLETLLLDCPGVQDCAVVRGYSDSGEEHPVAVIVGDASEHHVMNFMAERVNRYEQIREVRYVSSIPRSAAGKTLRRALAEDFQPPSA